MVPGGKLKPGESLEDSAYADIDRHSNTQYALQAIRRELKEEINLQTCTVNVTPHATNVSLDNGSTVVLKLCLVNADAPEEITLNPKVHKQLFLMSKTELMQDTRIMSANKLLLTLHFSD